MAAGARAWRPARPPASCATPPWLLARGHSPAAASARCVALPWLLACGHSPAAASARCAAPPWLLARGRGPAAASARCAAPPGLAACSRGSLAWLARDVAAWSAPGVPARLRQPTRLARGGLRGAWQPVRDVFAAATRSRAQQRSATSFTRLRSLFVCARSSAPAWLPVARSAVHGQSPQHGIARG
jgi:hypothetical protein